MAMPVTLTQRELLSFRQSQVTSVRSYFGEADSEQGGKFEGDSYLCGG